MRNEKLSIKGGGGGASWHINESFTCFRSLSFQVVAAGREKQSLNFLRCRERAHILFEWLIIKKVIADGNKKIKIFLF